MELPALPLARWPPSFLPLPPSSPSDGLVDVTTPLRCGVGGGEVSCREEVSAHERGVSRSGEGEGKEEGEGREGLIGEDEDKRGADKHQNIVTGVSGTPVNRGSSKWTSQARANPSSQSCN